jgi:hypothetical protein
MRIILSLILMLSAVVVAAEEKADALLERSRKTYAALKSYADSGAVTTEYNGGSGPTITEHHTFVTYFRAPKQFFFDFKADRSASGDRFVLWIDGAEVHTWWQATGVHEKYEKGQGPTGFANGVLPTKGSVTIVASLLFPGLQSVMTDLQKPRVLSPETLDGRPCARIIGDFAPAYSNGAVTSTSSVTVWIDSDSLLVRKILVETPNESPRGVIDRSIAMFAPHANPELKTTLFRFSVP